MLTNVFRYALLGLLFINQVLGQEKIDANLLQEELILLGDIAIETSPKLTEEERSHIRDLIEQHSKEIDGKSMNAIEFLNFFSGIGMSTQFDEHAKIEISQDMLTPLLSGTNLFPLPIRILHNRVVVNGTNDILPYGSIIYAINGQPIDSILAILSKDSDTFSKRRMEKQFSIVYAIKNPPSDSYIISYSEPSDEVRQEKELAGIDVGNWIKKMNEESVYPLNMASLNNLVNTQYYPDNKAYYFQLNSFIWDDDSEKGLFDKVRGDSKNFAKTFKNIFTEIDELGAETLILDLRHNSGGSIYIPGLLYSYMSQKPFIEHARLDIPDFSFPHEEYITELNDKAVQNKGDLKKFVKRYRSMFEESESGYYWEAIEQQEQEPQKNAFQGKVYVLVGGRSISAASYFAALFKGEKRGTIVGEEMGGSHHAITAGTTITYQLPHTKLNITVPLMLVNFADDLYEKVPELKIIPDVELSEESYYESFLNKQDPELERVFRLMRGD